MKNSKLLFSLLIASMFTLTAHAQTTNKKVQSEITGEDLLGIKSGADPKHADKSIPGRTRKKGRPVIFIIGDSTVKNGHDDGRNGQWGWGHFFWEDIDTTKFSVENFALGGRSSRTYISEGHWAKVRKALRPGDYVLVQFGHNDNGSLNKGRARASLHSNSDRDTTVVMELTGKKETVHSFGWYMRKYAKDARAKGATAILFSHIPRNLFYTRDSLAVIRNTKNYGAWTKAAAKMVNTPYIDLNKLIAVKLDRMGKDSIQLMFHGDHTHTSLLGAKLNATTVAEGIRDSKNKQLKRLQEALKKNLTIK